MHTFIVISNIPESLYFSLFWTLLGNFLPVFSSAFCMRQIGLWSGLSVTNLVFKRKIWLLFQTRKFLPRTKTVIRKIIKLWKQIKLLTGESRGPLGFAKIISQGLKPFVFVDRQCCISLTLYFSCVCLLFISFVGKLISFFDSGGLSFTIINIWF